MKKLALAALLAITPVTFAETLEHVEEEVHLAMETIQQLKAEINDLREALVSEVESAEKEALRRVKEDKDIRKQLQVCNLESINIYTCLPIFFNILTNEFCKKH